MLHAGYRKGSDADKQANRAIWEDAERRLWNDPAHDIGENWFVANYGIGPSRTVDEDVLASRMHFVCDPAGEPIATITAWFAEGNPASLGGVVHNVAIKSSHDGKGLSKPLMAAVLLRTEPGQYFIPPSPPSPSLRVCVCVCVCVCCLHAHSLEQACGNSVTSTASSERPPPDSLPSIST